MLIVMLELVWGGCRLGRWLAAGAVSNAPVLPIFFFQMVECPTLLPLLVLKPCLHLFLDALLPLLVLENWGVGFNACVGHFLDRWKPALAMRQARHRVRNPGHDVLGIPRQHGCNGRHVGLWIVGITRSITAEQEPRPLRCVARLLLVVGHRSRQFFCGDRQRLE